MDPQSVAFTPLSNNETWRLQNDLVRVQQVQVDHTDRILRLERRQDDDTRLKSVWGNTSPFPSVLSGTPQQAPLQQPPSDQFRTFDDEANNLISSLHLDAEEEPRRSMGANSRANSVRFDESANQGHWAHASRSSVDFIPRMSSGLGGLAMTERTSSHKSDTGRASSAHSIRSAASGRAHSLNLETGFTVGDSYRWPLDTPGLAPGLLLLGAVPAIIRCWMNTNFKHDALLYSAVCTGSYKSFLDLSLIRKLGFEEIVKTGEDSQRTVELPVYFPEAVPHPASSRSSSPVPQLPTLTVDFQVVERTAETGDGKSIQVFLGSDVLRAHNADILFSSNSMTLFDDDRSKLSIPLVRPENEATFKDLYITNGVLNRSTQVLRVDKEVQAEKPEQAEQPYLNGLGKGSSAASVCSKAASPPPSDKYRPPGAVAAEIVTEPSKTGTSTSDSEVRPSSNHSAALRPSLSLINTLADTSEVDVGPQMTALRSGSGPAIWSNWRRDGATSTTAVTAATSNTLDWASAGRGSPGLYQRQSSGIKVLKPTAKPAARAFSISAAPASAGLSSSADSGKSSRFFDEGRRRSIVDNATQAASTTGSTASSAGDGTKRENAAPAPTKSRANPIGGASAFAWLNSSGTSGSK